MTHQTKLVVIGWDAADWAMLNPLLRQGKMPALASLISRGFHGKLASLQPMLSPLLWTSVATGVRPHEHGILNFVEVDDQSQIRSVRGSSRKVPAFWEILKDQGIRSNVIGWWPSHPASDTGGVSISNFYARSSDDQLDALPSDSVYPISKREEYDDLRVHVSEITAEILAPFFSEAEILEGKDPIVSGVARIIANTASTHAAATEAMLNGDWDMTAVYYDAIDHFKHLAMAYCPPKSDYVSDTDYQNYHKVVEAGYRFHDMMLDRIMELAGSDCHFLLLSDHGFAAGSERKSELPDIPGAPATEHFPYGILVGAGPQWKSQRMYGHSLLDICPAILHLFDQPISKSLTGNVPLGWWRNPTVVRFRDYYPENHSEDSSSSADEAEMLADLERIGYIDLPENHGEAIRQVQGDSRYNAIISMLDGGLWQSAFDASNRLIHDYPDRPRYLYQNLGISLMVEPATFENRMLQVTEAFPSVSGDYFLGMHALRHGFYEKALEHFQDLASKAEITPQLAQSIGRVLLQAGKTTEAIDWLVPIHDQFNRWPESSLLLAEAWLTHEEDKVDLERALDYALEATRRRYYFPEAHLMIARLAVKLKASEAAEAAYLVYLQMAPQDQIVMGELVSLLRSLDKHREADDWQMRLNADAQTVIVTGWPRSGTSLMMQWLQRAGIDLYTDEKRKADAFNPRGYFEAERVNQLHLDASFMEETNGMAIKVVIPHLHALPGNRRYKVIWMNRPISEVVVSQETMLGKDPMEVKKYFPFGKAMQMEAKGNQAKQRLESSGNCALLEVNFEDCIHQPEIEADRILSFLEIAKENRDSLIREMISTVNKDLYRSRM